MSFTIFFFVLFIQLKVFASLPVDPQINPIKPNANPETPSHVNASDNPNSSDTNPNLRSAFISQQMKNISGDQPVLPRTNFEVKETLLSPSSAVQQNSPSPVAPRIGLGDSPINNTGVAPRIELPETEKANAPNIFIPTYLPPFGFRNKRGEGLNATENSSPAMRNEFINSASNITEVKTRSELQNAEPSQAQNSGIAPRSITNLQPEVPNNPIIPVPFISNYPLPILMNL